MTSFKEMFEIKYLQEAIGNNNYGILFKNLKDNAIFIWYNFNDSKIGFYKKNGNGPGEVEAVDYTEAKKNKRSYVKNKIWEKSLTKAMIRTIKDEARLREAKKSIEGKTDIFDIVDTIAKVGKVSPPSKKGIPFNIAEVV